MSNDRRDIARRPLEGQVLPAESGIDRDTPLVPARAPLSGVIFQRIYLEVTTRAWKAFNDLASEYRRSYQIHSELILAKENYERALHRFRHLPSILYADTQMLMSSLERDVLAIQEEAMAVKHSIEERKLDHEIAMEEKRRKLAALRGDKEADAKYRQVRRETGLNEARFKKAMSEARVLEAEAVLNDIREGAQNMASALAEDGSPLAKSSQEIFESALVEGRDDFVAEFIKSRGGRDKLSKDDRKLLENIDAVANWIRHNKSAA
jgi:hypothetical protein